MSISFRYRRTTRGGLEVTATLASAEKTIPRCATDAQIVAPNQLWPIFGIPDAEYPISPTNISHLVGSTLEYDDPHIHIPMGEVGAQSLRSGGETRASHVGNGTGRIQKFGRWGAQCRQRYIAASSTGMRQIGALILQRGPPIHQLKRASFRTSKRACQKLIQIIYALAQMAYSQTQIHEMGPCAR